MMSTTISVLGDPTGAGVGGERPCTGLGGDAKRHQQGHKGRKMKVVRLSDIISVLKLPPHAEALPKVNLILQDWVLTIHLTNMMIRVMVMS